MRIFNEEKTQELKNVDETKGYLKDDKLFKKHIKGVKEQGHFEVVKEYENGGKDVEWVVDVKAVEEHDEFEAIKVFVPFDAQTLNRLEIQKIKQKLEATDYKAIKYAEGILSEEEFAQTKAQRQAWREKINELEKEI